MRIISGKLKGRRLNAPKKLPVRPTTDMAKEGLFNILNNRYFFEEIKVLDLFAGTGNISFEFASRGATNITAVDGHSGCIKFIEKTADQLNTALHILKNDAFQFLERTPEKYDVVFADPPYDMELARFSNLIDIVFKNGILNDDGLLVIEHATQMNFENHQFFLENRKYGSSVFSFFQNII